MPENEEKESLHQELTYEIENPDVNLNPAGLSFGCIK